MKKRSEVIIDYLISKTNLDILMKSPESFYVEETDFEKDLILAKKQIDEEIILPVFKKYFDDELPIGISKWSKEENSHLLIFGANLETLTVYTKAIQFDNHLYSAYREELSQIKSSSSK